MTIRVGLLKSGAVLGYNDMEGRETMLDEVMKELKITTKALSEMTGIPKQTLDAYRAGRREPSLSIGLRIADALRVDPHRLISSQEGPEGRTECPGDQL